MSEIRLNKLVKKYNIGLQDLVDFLSKEDRKDILFFT